MRLERTSKLTPKGPPRELVVPDAGPIPSWDGESVNWEAMVAWVIHPVKVAIIEAVAWIGEPLSPSQMAELFDGSGLYLSLLSYHAKALAGLGVFEVVRTRPARGATERFYYFPDPTG